MDTCESQEDYTNAPLLWGHSIELNGWIVLIHSPMVDEGRSFQETKQFVSHFTALTFETDEVDVSQSSCFRRCCIRNVWEVSFLLGSKPNTGRHHVKRCTGLFTVLPLVILLPCTSTQPLCLPTWGLERVNNNVSPRVVCSFGTRAHAGNAAPAACLGAKRTFTI